MKKKKFKISKREEAKNKIENAKACEAPLQLAH